MIGPSKIGAALLAAGLLAGCEGQAWSAAKGEPDLREHIWRHRVLLLEAPSPEDADHRRQSAWLEAAAAGVRERDLVILTRPAAAFRVRLIGKDGGVKFERSVPVGVPELFALIDAMPMRRAEMSGR